MLNLDALLAPLFKFVRETTRQGLHAAMQSGAADFVADVSAAVRERPVVDHAAVTRRLLLGADDAPAEPPVVAMPSAAQVTEPEPEPPATSRRKRS